MVGAARGKIVTITIASPYRICARLDTCACGQVFFKKRSDEKRWEEILAL
jgi:hypothetical protein